jgi:hypothetical protein
MIIYLREIIVDTRNWVESVHDMDYWGVLANVEFKLQFQ